MKFQSIILTVLLVLTLATLVVADGHSFSLWAEWDDGLRERVALENSGVQEFVMYGFNTNDVQLTREVNLLQNNQEVTNLLPEANFVPNQNCDARNRCEYEFEGTVSTVDRSGQFTVRALVTDANNHQRTKDLSLLICADSDSDGLVDPNQPQACQDQFEEDQCPNDPTNTCNDVCEDDDNDGVCNEDDICPAGDDSLDTDGDGTPDACDDCQDIDNDGVCDGDDNCPGTPNPDQSDVDNDGIGDLCDLNDDRDLGPEIRNLADVEMDEDDPTVTTQIVTQSRNGEPVTIQVFTQCGGLFDIPCNFENGIARAINSHNVPDHVTVEGNQLVINPDFETVIHPALQRVDTLVVSATAGNERSQETVTITINDVNRDPVLDPIADVVVLAGDVARFDADATDPDNEDNPIENYRVTNLADFGFANMNPQTGQFAWRTVANDVGAHVANLQAHDDFGGLAQLDVNLLVCADSDGDGLVDPNQPQACQERFGEDECPNDPENLCNDVCQDDDNDGVCNEDDQCPGEHDGIDQNGNGIPDCAEDQCPDNEERNDQNQCVCIANHERNADGQCVPVACPQGDGDNDGHCDDVDNCPAIPNPDQADADDDGIGDICDICPNDPQQQCQVQCPQGDGDQDGVCDNVDNCPAIPNPDQADADNDGVGDACDLCLGDDAAGDEDRDAVCDDIDNCPNVPNQNQADLNRNGIGDACEIAQPDNDGPRIVSTPVTVTRVGNSYQYDVDAIDPDNDPLTYELLNGPAGMSIDPDTGLITYLADDEGNYQVVVKVSDGQNSAVQRYTLRVRSSFRGVEISHIYISEDYVAPGQSFTVQVQLDNEGYEDLDDVEVTVTIPQLGVRSATSDFDLDDRSLETRSTQVYLPYWAPEGEYLVRITVDGEHNKDTFHEHAFRTVYVMNWR